MTPTIPERLRSAPKKKIQKGGGNEGAPFSQTTVVDLDLELIETTA